MPSVISFYYAIFKKFQAAAGNIYAFGQEHFAPEASNDVAGGFSLRAADDTDGVMGALSSQATMYGVTPGWRPINPNSNDPMLSPLYVMLKTSLGPTPLPPTVTVNGQVWPVMPQPDLNQSVASYPFWLEFNQGNPKLIDAMAGWITAGKAVDTPQANALKQATLAAAPPKPFGFAKGSEFFPILFVASFSGDDGRRPGDSGVPAVPANYVPAHYWNSAQIFLTYPPGVAGHPAGTSASPAHLQPGEEYYVAVIVGNSGNQPAGRVAGSGGKMIVAAEAQAFNSGWGPATPPLPALSNLDPAILASDYEQYHLRAPSYDVVGFRFNVDSVIAGLKAAIAAAQNINLGGMSVEEWLNDSHPCIKVLIKSGEPAGPYTPQANALPTFDSNPRTERHAAQRNLAPFLIPVMMAKKIGWKNFMVAQMGAGSNQLAVDHGLSPNIFRVYLAMPTATYERYVAKGRSEGFEVVREGVDKPFPDAVILRQTIPGARLVVAEHAKEAFLGLSLGIGWEPRRIRPTARFRPVSLVHYRQDGTIGGGFTLQLQVTR